MTIVHDHRHHHHHHGPEHHEAGAGTSERAFGGPVVIDVGPGVGALVVRLGREWLDHEIHLTSLDTPGWSTHTGVWERRMGGASPLVAAVYPSLPEGRYGLLDHDGRRVVQEVDVDEARVTEIDLR
jgi:hypothetical protein